MLETYKILKERLSKDSGVSTKATRTKVRNSIDKMCKEYLRTPDAEFVFEAKPSNINDVIAVIDEPPLSDKYYIMQSVDSISIFIVRLKEVDVWKG